MKSDLQARIDTGEFANIAELLAHVSNQGHFQDRIRQSKRAFELPAGYWIYGLFADAGTEQACYIGQTVDYHRRARDHARGREGRSAWEMLQWAETRRLVVQFALLDLVPGQRSPAAAAIATMLEGTWMRRAQKASYLTPGSERWGTFPRTCEHDDFLWSGVDLAEAGRPLRSVFMDQLLPADIAIRPLKSKLEHPG